MYSERKNLHILQAYVQVRGTAYYLKIKCA